MSQTMFNIPSRERIRELVDLDAQKRLEAEKAAAQPAPVPVPEAEQPLVPGLEPKIKTLSEVRPGYAFLTRKLGEAATAMGPVLGNIGGRIVAGADQVRLQALAENRSNANKSFSEIFNERIQGPEDGGINWSASLQAMGAVGAYLNSRYLAATESPDANAAKAQEYQLRAADAAVERSQIPMSETSQAFGADYYSRPTREGFFLGMGSSVKNFFEAATQNPSGAAAFLLETSAESAPLMGLAITAGALTRSPQVAAAFMGLGSATMERYTGPLDYLVSKGIDLNNPVQLRAAISDKELMAEAANYGLTRAAIIGFVDWVAGVSAASELYKGPLANFAAQGVTQAGLGGIAETGAQAATKGPSNIDWNDVTLEALAEFTTAPIEVIGIGRQYLDSKKGGTKTSLEDILADAARGDRGAMDLLQSYGFSSDEITRMVNQRKAGLEDDAEPEPPVEIDPDLDAKLAEVLGDDLADAPTADPPFPDVPENPMPRGADMGDPNFPLATDMGGSVTGQLVAENRVSVSDEDVGMVLTELQTDGIEASVVKNVLARTPELQDGIRKLKAGEITKQDFSALVNRFKPVTPYASVPVPATVEEMQGALTSDKVPKIGATDQLEAGHPVGLRLDIPAYSRNGTWVVSVHEQKAGFGAGTPVGYASVARASNVDLGVVQNAAVNIAGGKPKATIATMKGSWVPTTPEQAKADADAALNDPAWRQIGMDPERHAYFYDRSTMQPITAAEEVIQIGPLVLGKNVTYADPNEFEFQTARVRRGQETLKKYGLQPGKKYTTRQVAAALEARQRKKYGVIGEKDFSTEASKKISSWMVEEIMFEVEAAEINPEKSAVGWYSTKFQRALDKLSAAFPEFTGTIDANLPGVAILQTQENARAFFTAMMAVTSDGAKVADNFRFAAQAYETFRKTGRVNSDVTFGGERNASMRINLANIQAALDTHGPDAMRTFLLQKDTISNLKKIAKAQGQEFSSAYKADMQLPYAALIFGPKLGAFYANLMGDTGYLTMDRWWSRTFNRYRGTLLQKPTEAGLKRFKELVTADKNWNEPPEMMSDDQALALTVDYVKAYEAKGYKNGTEIEKAANTLYKAAFVGLEDQPFNASDREFMVNTTLLAQKKLAKKGINLTVADIQAVLWYYEKRLYGQLGARQTQDISYEEIARKVVAARSDPAGGSADAVAGAAGDETSLDPGSAEDAVEIAADSPDEDFDTEAVVPQRRGIRVYRGSTAQETADGAGDFQGVFTSTDRASAAQYGEVSEFILPEGTQILDMNDLNPSGRAAGLIRAFLIGQGEPAPQTPSELDEAAAELHMLDNYEGWVDFVQSLGFQATQFGKDIRVFDRNLLQATEQNNAGDTEALIPRQPGVTLAGEPTRPAQGVADTGQADPAQMSLSEMSNNLVRLMGLIFRTGRVTAGRDALAQYRARDGVIRARQRNDFSSLVHESFHFLNDIRAAELTTIITRHQAELQGITFRHYGNPQGLNARGVMREGFAEFGRLFITNPAMARREAPGFFADFDALLQSVDPKMHQGFMLLRQQVQRYAQQHPSTEVVKGFLTPAKRKSLWNPSDAAEIIAEGARAERPETNQVTAGGVIDWVRRGMFEASSRVYAGLVDQNNAMKKLVYKIQNVAAENKKSVDVLDSENPYELLTKSSRSFMPAQIQLQYGIRPYGSSQSVGPSLRDAIAVAMGSTGQKSFFQMDETRMADFNAYLASRRIVWEYGRYNRGEIPNPPAGVTEGDARQAIQDFERKYGAAFQNAAAMVYEFNRNLLDKEFEAGLMTQEEYDLIKGYEDYVPLARDMSDRNQNFGDNVVTSPKGAIIKRFRGSSRNIINPLDAIMQRVFSTEKRIAENETIRSLAKLARSASDKTGNKAAVGGLVEEVPARKMELIKVKMDAVIRRIIDDPTISLPDRVVMEGILQSAYTGDEAMNVFRSVMETERGERIMFYRDEGKLKAIQLGDDTIGEDVFNLMKGLGHEKVPLLTEIIAMPSDLLRIGVTKSPAFLLKNYIRDQMGAWVNTNVGFVPFLTGAQGMRAVVTRSKAYQDYSAMMGMMGGMSDLKLHETRIEQDIEGLRQKGYVVETFNWDGFSLRSLGGLTKILPGIGRAVELAEAGTRVGIFKKAYDRAIRDGLSEHDALHEASRIATDYINYGRKGSKMATATRIIPFLNASIQGLDVHLRKMGGDKATGRLAMKFMEEGRYFPRVQALMRTLPAITQDSRKKLNLSRTELNDLRNSQAMWLKITAIALFTAALTMAYKDDEDYEETSDYLRRTGWIIPLPFGGIFYIPKPLDLVPYLSAVERGIEYAYGDESAGERFMNDLIEGWMPPILPPAINVGVGAFTNQGVAQGDGLTKLLETREIVPDYLLRLPPEQQVTDRTSETAKAIGEAMGWSPVKIDYMINSLFGTLGKDVSKSLDAIVNPHRPEMGWDDTFTISTFVRDSTRGGVSAEAFNELANRTSGTLTQAGNGYKRYLDLGDEQGAAEYLANLEDDDQRAWAILNGHFEAKHKRLHPVYRANLISQTVSGLRREMLAAEIKDSQLEGEFIPLSRGQKRHVDDLLADLVRRERRNALVIHGEPGFTDKKLLDVQTSIDLLRDVAPAAADELEARFEKAKIYDAQAIAENWPELKQRLLTDGAEAVLDDLLP